jgi:hypothetical protein
MYYNSYVIAKLVLSFFYITSVMDGGRDHEEAMFEIINEGAAADGGRDNVGAEDGLEFINDAGERMEIYPIDEAETSDHCDDRSYNIGKVY